MLFDAHIHYAATQDAARMEAVLARHEVEACTLQCIAQRGWYSTVPDALAFKQRHPETVYVNGGLERSAWVLLEGRPAALGEALVCQAKALRKAGCDGIKLLEGKPDLRRAFPIPDFDSESWEPFWAWAEAEQCPVTLHLNDPEDFWDESKINPYAKKEGWFYGPDTIDNEEQYRQMDVVLARHPGLRLQLAHLYFFSAQLPRLTALLRRYVHVRVDLTPGIELYTNLAGNLEGARAFFAEFGTRILYGSDIGSRSCIADPPKLLDEDESAARVAVIRTFLESEGAYTLVPDGKYLFRIPPAPMQGLALSERALQAVYRDNARALYGETPCRVNAEAAARLAAGYQEGLAALEAAGKL